MQDNQKPEPEGKQPEIETVVSPAPAITKAEYRLPPGLKLKLVLGGIALSVFFLLLGSLLTIFFQVTPFDDGPLNAIQRPILALSRIPADAHRQWLNLSETFSQIDHNYYEPDKIKHKDMLYEAATAAVKVLGDPYTQFVPPQRSDDLKRNLTGERVGIGILSQYNTAARNISIREVYESSPADKAGIKEGDIFVNVDGKPLDITGDSGKDLEALTNRLRGEKGSKVIITMQRPSDNNRQIDFEITRNDFVIPSVKARLLPDKLAYVQVSVFGDKTVSEFDQKVKPLLDQGATGLVLDLRGNGGGLANTAEQLLSRFLNGGTSYYVDIPADNVKYREKTIPDNSNGLKIYDLPVAVLINNSSASASEITAGALQARGRAQLIGQKTFGKGVAQTVVPLFDGSTIRITFEKWYTPNKIDISKQGLKPDIEVEQTANDQNTGQDPQLDRAEQYLLGKVAQPAVK